MFTVEPLYKDNQQLTKQFYYTVQRRPSQLLDSQFGLTMSWTDAQILHAASYGVPFVSKLHFFRDLVNNALYIK